MRHAICTRIWHDATMRRAVLLMVLTGSAALADPTGPPLPVKPAISPAQAAMTRYQGDYGRSARPKPCQRPKDGEIVVCGVEGRGNSPDRLPLPDERGARDWARLEIGEPPRAGAGGSPVAMPAGVGLTLTVKGGRTKVTGNKAE